MAVYAAHLTRTLQGTPSVFQVTAQEALGSTVKPAFRKFIEYLAAVYPKRCGWCLRWFDELYLVFYCCLQYHYLKHYAASFSESFYGLLRVPVSSSGEFDSGHHRLPELLEKGSLALLVLIPYFRDKVDKIIQKWKEDVEDGRIGKSTPDNLRRAAVKTYAIAHFCCEAAVVIQTARYLSGSAQSHSPLLAALGLTLKEAPPQSEDQEHSWTELARSILNGQIGRAGMSFPMVGGALLRAFEYGAFLVQFLRWWDSSRSTVASSLPVPPPPQKEERDERLKNKCPLCLRTWRIPTVLPVSGYIFCYVCISRHVRKERRCPATGLPADELSLIRLYID